MRSCSFLCGGSRARCILEKGLRGDFPVAQSSCSGTMGPGEDSPGAPPPLPSQLPLSSSHLNVYSGDPQVTASMVGVTSSSCPADLTQKRELTGTVLFSVPLGFPLFPFSSLPSFSSPLCFSGLQMLRAGPWPRSGRRKTITT